ncbi:radical SAM protein [Peribacillus frigoritolerans]|uniref:radical SAM/SPASM domain-containing protein n=1 Tax=Peribacillus frigoritolerans TaxID=450367 RepID=UPI0034E063D7
MTALANKKVVVKRKGNIAVYSNKGDYIIHNFILNSWVVLNPEEYEVANDYLFNAVSQIELSEKYNGVVVNKILNLIKLYKINSEKNNEELISNFTDTAKKNIPSAVYFVTTYKCNLSCIYCYAESGPNRSMKEDLTTDEAKKVILDIKGLGTKTIVFTGGEAFLRKDLMQLIEYSNEVGLEVKMITNGSFITNVDIAKKLSSLTKLITISVDSLKEGQHDKNRGRGSWKKAMKAIQLLMEAGGKLKINQTITTNNLDSIDDMIQYTLKNNMNIVVVPASSLGRGKQNAYELNYAQRLEFENTILRNRHDQGQIAKQFSIQQHCGHGLSEFSVDSRGNVYPCKLMHDNSFYAGNIKEQSLSNIYYQSDSFQESRDRHVDNLPICKGCSFKYLCGGGCRAIQWSETSKITGTNTHECVFIKATFVNQMWRYFRPKMEVTV